MVDQLRNLKTQAEAESNRGRYVSSDCSVRDFAFSCHAKQCTQVVKEDEYKVRKPRMIADHNKRVNSIRVDPCDPRLGF